GDLAGQVGRDKARGPVQAVGDDVLAAHLGALFLRIRLGGDSDAGDGDLLGQDGVDAAGKAQLDRAAHLAAVQRALDKGCHHRAEGADVVEVPAHEIADFPVQGRVVLFGGFQVLVHTQVAQSFGVAALEGHLVPDVDAVALGVLFGVLDVIADLPLQADVRHQAAAGLRVHTRHIAGVRVPIERESIVETGKRKSK